MQVIHLLSTILAGSNNIHCRFLAFNDITRFGLKLQTKKAVVLWHNFPGVGETGRCVIERNLYVTMARGAQANTCSVDPNQTQQNAASDQWHTNI